MSCDLKRIGLGAAWSASVLGISLLARPLPAQDGESAATPPVPVTWVYLDTGDNREARPQEEMAELQAAHVANLSRLAEEGKNLAAGPLDGNSKKTRGIVVMTVPVGPALKGEFAEDPFVEAGYLNVRSYTMRVLHGRVHAPVEPFEMIEQVITMVRRDPELDPEYGVELFEELAAELAADPEVPLALAVSFPDSQDRGCGVLMFDHKKAAAIHERLETRELLVSGELVAATHVQYVGRGIFQNPRGQTRTGSGDGTPSLAPAVPPSKDCASRAVEGFGSTSGSGPERGRRSGRAWAGPGAATDPPARPVR